MSGQSAQTRSQVTVTFSNRASHDEFEYSTPSEWAETVRDDAMTVLSRRSWCTEIEDVTPGSLLSSAESPGDMQVTFRIHHSATRTDTKIRRAVRATLRRETDAEVQSVDVLTPA